MRGCFNNSLKKSFKIVILVTKKMKISFIELFSSKTFFHRWPFDEKVRKDRPGILKNTCELLKVVLVSWVLYRVSDGHVFC
jgi:hypothetical protein